MDKVYIVVLWDHETSMQMLLKVFSKESDAYCYMNEQIEGDKELDCNFSYNVVERKVW